MDVAGQRSQAGVDEKTAAHSSFNDNAASDFSHREVAGRDSNEEDIEGEVKVPVRIILN